jgi:hypothetical protein
MIVAAVMCASWVPPMGSGSPASVAHPSALWTALLCTACQGHYSRDEAGNTRQEIQYGDSRAHDDSLRPPV